MLAREMDMQFHVTATLLACAIVLSGCLHESEPKLVKGKWDSYQSVGMFFAVIGPP